MHYIWLFLHWYLIGVIFAGLLCITLVQISKMAGLDLDNYSKEDHLQILYAPFFSWLFIIMIIGLIIEIKRGH